MAETRTRRTLTPPTVLLDCPSCGKPVVEHTVPQDAWLIAKACSGQRMSTAEVRRFAEIVDGIVSGQESQPWAASYATPEHLPAEQPVGENRFRYECTRRTCGRVMVVLGEHIDAAVRRAYAAGAHRVTLPA